MHIAYIGQKGMGVRHGGGGVERHVTEIATRLVGKGHQVIVYARRRYMRDGLKTYHGVKLKYLPTIYTKNLETIVHTLLSTLDTLFHPLDIIHYHGVGPATLAWIPRLFKRHARVIVTFHSQDRFHPKWGLWARLFLHFGEWAAVQFPHLCIAVSHVIQVYCRERYRRQVVYIPNGAQVHHLMADDQLVRFGLKPKEYLLNVGRIVPQKGLQYLIEAYDRLETAKKLVVVGAPYFSERYYNELRRLAAGQAKIIFLGHQHGEPLKQLFAHAYLNVQPSEAEGLAIVVLEAMSYGRPVLVSDIPENVEAIKGVGFTFENRNVDDLTARLRQLLNHPELVEEMGERAQELVAREFNWEVIADRIESVYVSSRH